MRLINRIGQTVHDLRWALTMLRVRRSVRRMIFSERERFYDELRPNVGIDRDIRIAWPHGMMWIERSDVERALASARSGGETP